jgi:hypothetical protein
MESPSGRKSRSSLTPTLRSSAADPASYMLWKITGMFSTRTNQKKSAAAGFARAVHGACRGAKPLCIYLSSPKIGEHRGLKNRHAGAPE